MQDSLGYPVPWMGGILHTFLVAGLTQNSKSNLILKIRPTQQEDFNEKPLYYCAI